MKILIEAPFDLSQGQKKEMERQVSQLSTFNPKITQADIFFKLDDGKLQDAVLAEIQLHVPGSEIFASDSADNYMKAFSSALIKAKQQILKRKDIRQDYHS